jgi:hypothetical protein
MKHMVIANDPYVPHTSQRLEYSTVTLILHKTRIPDLVSTRISRGYFLPFAEATS